MIARVFTRLDADADAAWCLVRKTSTMRHVMRGLVGRRGGAGPAAHMHVQGVRVVGTGGGHDRVVHRRLQDGEAAGRVNGRGLRARSAPARPPVD